MSLKFKFSLAIALLFAVGAFAGSTSAQDAAPKSDGKVYEKKGEFKRGMHGRRGFGHGMHGLRSLNLTDAQKEQIRAIRQANRPSETEMEQFRAMRESRRNGGELTEAQREQFKAFREQRRTRAEAMKAQIMAVLTSEQREQLEKMKEERKERREELREKRKEWKNK